MACAKLYSRKSNKGNRIYYVRYYLPGQRDNRRQFTIGSVSSRRAKEVSERIRAMVIQGVDPHDFAKQQAEINNESPKIKLADLIAAYLEHCAIDNRPSTINIKRGAFKRLQQHLGNCEVDSIQPEDIEKWMASMKLSKTTVNINLRAVRAMFNWGFKREKIETNIFENAGIKQYKVSDTDPDDYFSLEEVQLILEALKEKHEMMWRLIYLALETGGRISELLSLTGDDIDLNEAKVLFRGPSTKTGQRRHVPLRKEAVEIIKKWKINNNENIFPWAYAANPAQKFRKLLREMNLWKTRSGSRSLHTLRHTYASHLLMRGINIFIVSRWMGHSSVKVTEKHYGHVIPNTIEVDLPW